MCIQWKDVLKFYSLYLIQACWGGGSRYSGPWANISTLQHTLGAISVRDTNARSVARYRFVTSGRIQYVALLRKCRTIKGAGNQSPVMIYSTQKFGVPFVPLESDELLSACQGPQDIGRVTSGSRDCIWPFLFIYYHTSWYTVYFGCLNHRDELHKQTLYRIVENFQGRNIHEVCGFRDTYESFLR